MSEKDKQDVKEFEEKSTVDEDDDSEEENNKEDDESSDEDSEDTDDSSDSDEDDSEDEEEKETPSTSSKDKKPASEDESDEDSNDEDDKSDKGDEHLKDGIVETPREKALRLEVERLRGKDRKEKGKELFDRDEDPQPKKKTEMSPDKKEKLKKYDPKELENLKEVLEVMADDLGFVKKDEYHKTSFETQANDALEDFLEAHPEYDPVNDKDNVLWDRFKSEFSQYKVPSNPRDLKKLFKKIHNDVVGIKPASDLKKIEAKKEKLDTASHSASKKSKSTKKPQEVVDRSNRNVDRDLLKKGLKGFNDEEIDELLED